MHVLKKIFDWIFPPSEEESLVRNTTKEEVRMCFFKQNVRGVVALSKYKSSKIRALVHEAKFHNNKRAQELLNVLIQRYLNDRSEQFDIIIPIPLSKKRLRERGHNQVVSILQANTIKKINIETAVLKRKINTSPQTKLPREKRLENMNNAFVSTNPDKITNKNILLVDDVITTGATLRAAKAALLQHSPSSVTCVALAH